MKKYLYFVVLLLTSTVVVAQDSAPASVVISVGGGASSSSSALKKDALIGNGYNINADVFIPFLRKGWDGSVKGSGKFALGIIAGGTYNAAKNLLPDVASTQTTYKLYTGDLNIANTNKGSSNSTGFTGFAGLQSDFLLGRVTISPSVSGAYFSLTQDGFAQNSQVAVNGTTQNITLLESAKTTSTGFIIKPQFKISYLLTGNLGFYLAAALNAGPDITNTQSYLVPAGGFNAKNTYEAQQLTTGTRTNRSTESKYQTTVVNAGLSWSFGSGSANNSSRRLKGKVIKTGDQGAMPGSYVARSAGNPIGGIIIKGGKNPGGSTIVLVSNNNGEFEFNAAEAGNYKFTVTAPSDEPEDHRTYTGGRKNENVTATEVAEDKRTYTGGRKNESAPAAKGISEKGVKLTEDAPQYARPGSPIGGIVVKGGKNPGGSMISVVSNDNGEFEFNAAEAGNYKFTVTAPSDAAEEHRTYTGGRKNENATVTEVAEDKRTYTGGRKNESAPAAKGISEKGVKLTEDAPQYARPGSPIGGIVVKGGKNPGGSMISVVSNDNGEFEFHAAEAGNYKFTVTAPSDAPKEHRTYTGGRKNETATATEVAEDKRTYTGGRKNETATAAKGISEKGVKLTEDAPQYARPGSPIGGIVVKGGKNPGGSMISVVSNDNGEFEFKAAEAGNYKFTVTAPSDASEEHRTYTGGRKNESAPATSEVVEEHRTYTGGRKNENTSAAKGISEKGVKLTEDAPQYARPGSPIGGIVVKGGKNPGGSMISVVSNNNGEFEFHAAEAGNYKFTVTAPSDAPEEHRTYTGGRKNENATATEIAEDKRTYTGGRKNESTSAAKGISEKGVKLTEDAPQYARPGSPIGGIVVKGGKNPGGSMISVVSNNNGEVEFHVAEAGNYKFTITAP